MKPINWNSLKDKLATQNTEVSKNSNAISYKTYLQLSRYVRKSASHRTFALTNTKNNN